VTTHLFVAGSPYLDDDTVFGVKQSLIRTPQTVHDEQQARQYGLPAPFELLTFDIVLARREENRREEKLA
jgi:hypothetical protein